MEEFYNSSIDENPENDSIYEDDPYIPARDPREVNLVDQLEVARNTVVPSIKDTDVQEEDLEILENQISEIEGGYVSWSQVGEPGGVAPLNELGKVPDEYLPPSAGGQGIVALSLAGTLAEVTPEHVAIIPETSTTCAGLFSCENKQKLESLDPDILATKQEVAAKQDKLTAGTNITIDENNVISATGGGATYTAGANIQISAQNVISATDTIYDDTQVKSDIASLQSSKLNVLPKVDDPTDPGFGWEYHIPYRFDVSLDAEKADIDLHTLTLDNKVTKMVFNKQVPSATTTTAGLMSAADKTSLEQKLNILPKVDDPTDPGYGWPYHIPYDVAVTPSADKIDLTLKTLTLDNNLTKMNFSKELPGATTTTAGLMSASDKVALAGKQDKLTAGTNITIDENNVISATGGGTSADFDNKTIIKGTDNKYQTAIGGWKETTPEQSTELFIDTKGTGLPTYFGPGSGPTKYEVGWDYNTTITSLVSGATTAVVHSKITVLGTAFDGNVTLNKSQSIPAIWESSDLTIGSNTYKIKVYDQYLGTNQGGLGLISNNQSLDLSDATMQSCALVTTPASTVYHPLDNNFLNLDNDTIIINSEGKLQAVGGGASYQAGNGISIDSENNTISAALNSGLEFQFGGIAVKAADRSIESADLGVCVRRADNSLSTVDDGLKVNTDVIQPKLTAGTNITIENNVISSTGGSGTLSEAFTANQTVGGVTAGDTFPAGTSLEFIIKKILFKSSPVGTTYLYKGVVDSIPTSVSGLTSVEANKATLLSSGYTYSGITTNNQYAVLAIDKSLGIRCTVIKASGFELEFIEKDLGDQYLYHFEDPTTGTNVKYVYEFEEG